MKCSRCNRESTIEIPHSKESLCNPCWSEAFEKRIRKTIRTNRLLAGSDITAVALSGGKDSAVCLYFLKKLSDRIPTSRLIAISIDQGIGNFQEKSLEAAKKLCLKLDVEHHMYSLKEEYGKSMDEIVEKSSSIPNPAPPCSYCGVLRRRLLNEKCLELGVSKMATGHNLDDEIQAGLMNYVRGDFERIARMGAIVGVMKAKGFVPRIKPLRSCLDTEVRLFADLKKLPYEPARCPYSGEAFRKTVREVIEKIESNHPGSKFQMLKSTDKLIPLLRENITHGQIKRCGKCNSPTSGEVCKFCEIKEQLGLHSGE